MEGANTEHREVEKERDGEKEREKEKEREREKSELSPIYSLQVNKEKEDQPSTGNTQVDYFFFCLTFV
jgi:hypothetical protein